MKKKLLIKRLRDECLSFRKTLLIMKITLFLLFLSLFQTLASSGYSQAKISLDSQAMTVNEVLNTIEEQTEYFFLFNSRLIDVHRRVSIRFENEEVENALEKIFEGTDVEYLIKDRQIILTNQFSQLIKVSGKVTNTLKEPISGVTIFIKGTTQGVISDREGNYTLADVPGNATLVFSFVGMKKQEIFVNNQLVIDVVMEEETIGIDEVVAIGYGVVKKSDLTGSVSQIDPDILKHQSTSQITDLLTGTVAGIYLLPGVAPP